MTVSVSLYGFIVQISHRNVIKNTHIPVSYTHLFTAENAQISKEIQGYLTAIPEKYLDFVEAFVNEVKEKEGMKLNDSIYFSLSDHIMGAISRLENGIRLQNMLLLDIKQLYHKEYEIGLELLKKVNEMFEVDLSADEAGFFACLLYTSRCV